MKDNSSEDQEKPGTGLAFAIIGFSLAAGIGIALSPPAVRSWILAIIAIPATLAAAVKFAASGVLEWRRKSVPAAILWAVLSGLFLLLLLADGQHFHELVQAAKGSRN